MKNDDYYDKSGSDSKQTNPYIDLSLSRFTSEELEMELKRRNKLQIQYQILELKRQIEELTKQL